MAAAIRRKEPMGRAGVIRRSALAVAGGVWLAGFHFFYDGFYHMAAFWLVLAPLAVANVDLLTGGDRRWRGLLLLLLAWQLGCGVIHLGEAWSDRDGLRDVVAVLILGLVVLGIVDRPWGWWSCRAAVFVSGVVVSLWSLWQFYPLSDLGLGDARLRNVLIYPTGLNAVLTGLLAGFSMVAGLDLHPRDSRWRWPTLAGLAVLAFAVMATQSRGAMLGCMAGLVVMLVFRGRRVLPELAACGAGVVAYLAVFAWTGDGTAGPDLVERGATGRWEIWQTYLGNLEGAEWWIGTGGVAPLGESVLGWFVHHPHGSWVSQLVWCGIPGLLLLGALVALAAWNGWRGAARDATPLALLAFGVAGLIFDGAQIVSLASVPRIEPLLVFVPALVALAMAERRSDEVRSA